MRTLRLVTWIGGGIVGAVVVIGVFVQIWLAAGLPTVAFSHDIKRLDRNQVLLSIKFHDAKAIRLLRQKIFVSTQLIEEETKAQHLKNVNYILDLKKDQAVLQRERKQTEEEIKRLHERAIKLEGK